MTSRLAFWRKEPQTSEVERVDALPEQPQPAKKIKPPDLDIAPDDPVLVYFQNASGPVDTVDMQKLAVDSPGAQALHATGVRLAVPLVSQGELIGIINLGSRLSEQDYSSDGHKLLNDLASQAAPAVRVAQLVCQLKIEAAERERIEQELRVARIVPTNAASQGTA